MKRVSLRFDHILKCYRCLPVDMGIEAMYEGTSWYGEIDTGEAPPPESTFDVIVVGGGPGGSSAAGYLAMEGKKVLLIEKEIWPRDKICGDAVGGKSLSHVKDLGVKTDIESTDHFRVTGILFSSCLLYTSPSPRDATLSRMPSSA